MRTSGQDAEIFTFDAVFCCNYTNANILRYVIFVQYLVHMDNPISVHCSKGYHGYYDYHYDFEDFYSHPSDHNHSNVTYIYHDYYVRTREGETAELCAELSNTLDEPLEIYYTSDYNISTEINEGDLINTFLLHLQLLFLSQIMIISKVF